MAATHQCDHCGKVSPSLLRCTQCQSVWYCNRTCQSLAWNRSGGDDGKEGHRKMCRRLRKKLAAASNSNAASLPTAVLSTAPTTMEASQTALSSMATASSPGEGTTDALVELMQRVQTMDCNEAHKHMCLAQDEIQRLQSEIKELSQQSQEMTTQEMSNEAEILNNISPALTESKIMGNGSEEKTMEGTSPKKSMAIKPNDGKQVNITAPTSSIHEVVRGFWLDQGGRCSIEYLPNVKCYSVTLTSDGKDALLHIPQSEDELHFTMGHINGEENDKFSSPISYYEAKLYKSKDTGSSPSVTEKEHCLLISITLPTTCCKATTKPSVRISLDTHSITLRIQLQYEVTAMATDSMDLMDNLLGIMEGSSSSSITTNASEINHLRCRSCQKPIIGSSSKENAAANNGDDNQSAIIQSVLPLPSGYWDDISDYLICYDGQATVDFTSSTTNAIRRMALEDDAILVLHQQDLKDGGIRSLGVKGYGEHSMEHLNGTNGSSSASQAWKDGAATKGERSKAVTCANCCSTLGFVSDHDAHTYRLYKHLMDCGRLDGGIEASVFSKYTCGSFLAREMVRYAESDAVYTFIVGISDENDWTRVHNSGPYILLRMLSWDSPMATVGGPVSYSSKDDDDDSHEIHYRKVVKVIFEEITDNSEPTSINDDSSEWTWGGTDFCCPPPTESNAAGSNLDDDSSARLQTKASSIRIFFSKQEWSQLRDGLICGSQHFSETVKCAVVMTKLGLPSNDKEQTASLSFLPLVS